MLAIKRVYEKSEATDGIRILVDRLWPRGLSKEKAHIEFWMKEIAPSTELRKWFGHDPEKWREFKKRYIHELFQHQDLVQKLAELAKIGHVTLVYASRDEENNASVLQSYIKRFM